MISLIMIHLEAKLNLSLTNLPIRWCSLIDMFLECSKILSSMYEYTIGSPV